MKNAVRLVDDVHQKNFVRLLESCCGKYGRWENWSEFVSLTAIAISNAVDKVHAAEREKTFQSIEAKHTKAEMEAFAGMYTETILGFEENPNQDFLGELFMRLDLGSEHNGQFFTPYHICELMSAVTTPDIKQTIDKQGWIGVADPCCGAGALLVAFANHCQKEGVNYQTSVLFAAQDIDYTVGLMCYIQLSLLGCAGYVVIGDSLLNPTISVDRRGLIPVDNGNVWYTPMYLYRDIWVRRRLCAQMDMLLCENCTAPKPQIEPQTEKPTETAKEQPQEKPKEAKAETPLTETKSGQLSFF